MDASGVEPGCTTRVHDPYAGATLIYRTSGWYTFPSGVQVTVDNYWCSAGGVQDHAPTAAVTEVRRWRHEGGYAPRARSPPHVDDQRLPRLTAAATARREAVTMFASMPTPQTTVPLTSAST